jgi:Type ISP C-terminal specificity domain
MVFPLYLYPETKDLFATQTRTPNLNPEILRQITEGVGLQFVAEHTDTVETRHALSLHSPLPPPPENERNQFTPIDLLDYIYAVLHSPDYRETYKEFLKIDFPRVPYPKDAAIFWQLVALGGALRQIHLLESPVVEKYITQYPIDGTNTVTKPVYKDGNVYINETQYFKNVPEVAWNFYIGGYQPVQKWLKDRRERVLEFEDILHYQKIIVALSETDRLMAAIKEIEISTE